MERVLAARVVLPDEVVGPAAVVIDGEHIAAVEAVAEPVPDRTLTPGFVDLQVNGIGPVDVASATGGDWDVLDRALLAQGVTTWCPTLVTAPLDSYPAALDRIAAAAARTGRACRPAIAGAHLEGPFLGGAPGAHPAELVRPPDPDWIDRLPPIVRVMTLAPEPARATDAVAALVRRGVLASLGHSNATYDEACAAIDAGARLATHCFNGMAPLHHRAPGLVGAALSDDRVAVSVIADLVHVHPAVVRVVFRAKGRGRVALVTDAVASERNEAGPVRFDVVDGVPRLADGTLAGATVTMDGALRNVVDRAGVALVDAVHAASTTPARLLGLHDRGAIAPGCRADLVALDSDLRVVSCWVGGQLAG